MITTRLRGSASGPLALILAATLGLAACATTGEGASSGGSGDAAPARQARALPAGMDAATNPDPYPSTYRGLPRENLAIVGATVFTGDGRKIDNGVVILTDGKVAAVGDAATPVPGGHRVVDGRGRYVTPGIIDVHSHLGVYPSPGVQGMSDGNEATNPNTPRSGPSIRSGRRTRASTPPVPAVSPPFTFCPARPICSAAAVSPCAMCPR